MSQPTKRYTFDYSDYARFPDDGNRYEVIDGEVLVTPAPSPNHQHILATLLIALRQYVEREGIGIALPDVDLLFVEGQFLRPDLLVVPAAAREGVTRRGVEKPPALVVEILSPTSASIDRVKKPARYGDFGIPESWVVDPDERVVWVWRFAAGSSEPARVADRIDWHHEGATEPFTMDLDTLFRPMW